MKRCRFVSLPARSSAFAHTGCNRGKQTETCVLPQGYISTSHMRWFLEAEGSRNYEDEDTMNALLRKLDTNGDGQVPTAPRAHVGGIFGEDMLP